MTHTASLLWHQFRFERRQFWRNPSAAFFNFMLPLILLLLIASVFSTEKDELEVLIPGIAGMSVMSTTFTALAFNITSCEEGVLKRMLGTPLPPSAYFGGLIANAVVNAVIQVVLVVLLGHLLYDVVWPKDVLSLAVFTALGVLAFGALGIAFSHAIPNFDAAPAYVNAAVFLPLIFISGVFYSTDTLPALLDAVAQALPLKHVIDGLSGAIVDGSGVGDHLTAVAVLGGWFVAGLALAVRFFRWE